MSVRVMTRAWDADLAAMDKLVLLALADWANDDGQCWPSIAQLCKKSGASRRYVQMAIKRMSENGHLSRVENPGKGAFYTIHPRTTCAGAPHAPVHHDAETRAPRAPNTSRTVIDTPNGVSKARAAKALSFQLPAWVPAEAWAGYEEMRRKMRKGMTIRAKELAIGKLGRLRDAGHDPGAVLDQSVMNSWQGLFEVKGQHNGNGHMERHNGQGAGQRNGQPLRGSRTMEFLRNVQRELQAECGDEGGAGGVSYSLALPGSDG